MESSISLFKESNNNLWVMNVKLRLANDFVSLGKISLAINIFQELLETSKSFNRLFYNITLIDYSICCYHQSEDNDNGINLLEEAYSLANES
ncbi:MAG: hypothetical protein K1X91_16800, partial [Bacteriodetes bacterium]|nr:hypothetical protein [Bacteroidota bacterium]